jgi:hypothetical protein
LLKTWPFLVFMASDNADFECRRAWPWRPSQPSVDAV